MSLRICTNINRSEPISISVDGRLINAYRGESLAAALLAAGISTLRYSPAQQQPRGLFCLMGTCQECLLTVDGRRRLACQTPVADGMQIITGGPDGLAQA